MAAISFSIFNDHTDNPDTLWGETAEGNEDQEVEITEVHLEG